MSGLDFLGGVAVVVSAWMGVYTGWIVQAGRCVVLLAAVLLARAMIVPIAGFYQRVTENEPQVAVALSFLAVVVLLYGALLVAMNRMTSDLRDADWRTPMDRVAGALVGVVHGVGAVVVVTVVLLNFSYGSGRPAIDYDASRLGQVAMQRDFLQRPAADLRLDTEIYEEERPGRRHLRGYEREHLEQD